METRAATSMMDPAQYPPVLLEANKIIEDFPNSKYVIYFILFSIETALAFWIALSI